MADSLDHAAMQLDDFISSTLTQIVGGVRRAQEGVIPFGAYINPQVEGRAMADVDLWSGTFRQNVEFDIAVTVTRTSGSGAGLKVAAFGIGGSVQGKSDLEHAAVSRIKFSIPVVFPKQFARGPDDEGFVPPIK